MRATRTKLLLLALVALSAVTACGSRNSDPKPSTTNAQIAEPARDFVVLVHSELGMHCTGFDFSYCCILPPYNSVLAQVVRTDRGTGPRLLSYADDDQGVLVDGRQRFRLAYRHEDAQGKPNTHSEHKKMVYWGADYEGLTLASRQFRHLYVYDDFAGGNASGTTNNEAKKRVGEAWHIKVDRGPTNHHVGRGFLHNSGSTGTVFFTDSPAMENVPLQLTPPNTWEALGLPLTPFNDYVTSMFFIKETDIRPFQRAVVTLVDASSGAPIFERNGGPASGFGVNPIDVPACDRCHAGTNANGDQYRKYEIEYDFWRNQLQTGEWFARLKAASISMLEIHDAKHGTNFTARYPAGGTLNTRLGHDSVRCQDCHSDNVVGVLQSKRIREIDPKHRGPEFTRLNPSPDALIPPLTEAIHLVHQRARPMPDAKGYSGACQGCHPAHRDDGRMDFFPIGPNGENPFTDRDHREAAGGCYVGRDAHSNRSRPRPNRASHLNAVGRWLRENVYEDATSANPGKGLWCTHCHSRLSRELYKTDRLTDAVRGEGETLRRSSLEQIATALGIDRETLLRDYLDARVPLSGPDVDSGVVQVWQRPERDVAAFALLQSDGSTPAQTEADADGDQSVMIADIDPASSGDGILVDYDAATHGRDYWLSPGEPHCADCHLPPFVESEGGGAFPIDQPGKYALMRYSRGHAGIHCQGCHGSSHGLGPVTPDVDSGSYAQAVSLNPDGSPGPIQCGACHRVNEAGVPVSLAGFVYKGKPVERDLDLAVELSHVLR